MADIELKGPPGELHFTVHIKRKATGLTETYEMVGHALPEEVSTEEAPPKSISRDELSGEQLRAAHETPIENVPQPTTDKE